MAREFFKDLPNTTTPLTASRLNGLLNGDEALGSIVVDDVNCKNMFDKGSFVAGDRKDAQPTIRISSRQVLYLEPGTYTFSTDLDTSVYRYEINTISSPAPVSSYDVLYGSGWKTTSTSTITVDNNTKGYFNLGIARINNSSLTLDDISSANIQLEKGSTATEYVEYKQPVKKTSIGVKESTTFYADDFKCKNLLGLTNGTYTASGVTAVVSNGTITLNGTPNASSSHITIPLLVNLELKANTNYTLSSNNTSAIGSSSSTGLIRLRSSEDDTTTDVSFNVVNNSLTFNKNEDKTYTGLKIRTASGVTYSNYVIRPQLEIGSEATPYTPYVEVAPSVETIDISSYKTSNVSSVTRATMKRYGKLVKINIAVSNTSTTSGTVLFSGLPFKPSETTELNSVNNNNQATRGLINTNGDISINTAQATAYYINGVFLLD